MRIEKDFIGEREINDEALYGIQSLRAMENFPDKTQFHIEWYKATGLVKKAFYLSYKDFKKAANEKYNIKELPVTFTEDYILDELINAADAVIHGEYFEHFIVPAISGGAGTSINMNVNEIIANLANRFLSTKHYALSTNHVDPIEHANIYQSTNDVIPTSLKIAVMQLMTELESSINNLRGKVEQLENRYRNSLRIGYTQMQEAVPTTYGKLFSTYSEALSRDWWRVSKCNERIKVVNIGGSAIGTGVGVPRFVIMEVIKIIQQLTGLPVTRGENLSDATSNLDSLTEVHAILKSHAVNLEKMASDIRLLSSDIGGNEISIPQKQIGSTIMPGKVNPVICEFVISASHKIYSNDILITSLCGQGCLELNAYLPTIGHALIESIKLLIAVDKTLQENLIEGLIVKSEIAENRLYKSPTIATVLNPYIGYNKSALLAKEMKAGNCDIFLANSRLKLIDEDKIKKILKPENLMKLGYTLQDLIEN